MLGLLSVRTAAPSLGVGGSGWGVVSTRTRHARQGGEGRGCYQLAGVSAQIRAVGGFSADPFPNAEPIKGPISCSSSSQGCPAGLSRDAELSEGVLSHRGEAVHLLFWRGVASRGNHGLWGGVLGTGFIHEGLSTRDLKGA